MTPKWILRHLEVPENATHVIVPGYCENGLEELAVAVEIPVICGPNDLREIPELFGSKRIKEDFGDYDIQIIAEINHAPRLSLDALVAQANRLRYEGADVIDFGCDPASSFDAVGRYVSALVEQGHKVSIDSFDPKEVKAAVDHGASLVLSVNSSNRQHALDWDCEVVVIPDTPDDVESLRETADFLLDHDVLVRLDPILEPVGTGFAASLQRYAKIRESYPDVPMMMGIGNITELTDVDSAGVNMLLLSICQELEIQSVLTTQVINWARSSVRECDRARRLTHYAIKHGVPPKRVCDDLVMLRDAKIRPYPDGALEQLAQTLKDNNYRIFAQDDLIYILAAKMILSDEDPFRLFERLMQQECSDNIDPGHAFYLGFEMAKASIALTLGKQYEQDQALDWGILTKHEDHHRLQRTSRHRKNS